MKSETRKAKLAALLAEGEEDEILRAAPKEQTKQEINESQTISREAESVLAFLRGDKLFASKKCNRCERTFLTDYACVSYCSDSCRRKNLEELGLTWDITKPLHERWGNPVPLVIPPEAVSLIEKCLGLTLLREFPVEQVVGLESVEIPVIQQTSVPHSIVEMNPVTSVLPELPDLDLEFDL